MGYSLSWVAIKNGNAEAIYSVLDLRPTGEWEEIPEFQIVGAELPTGWHLVLSTGKKWAMAFLSVYPALVRSYMVVSSRIMRCTAVRQVGEREKPPGG
jgi:hypothetical protein